MNKKEYSSLEKKLQELVNNDIISYEQFNEAKIYFEKNKKNTKPVLAIFGAIGIFLIALSIITLFAINWNAISKEIKVVISFIPIAITSVMLYFYLKNDDKKLELYTSIFAPISIIATNSLISQVFHMQTEIFELIFISMLMFMPIAFILRNKVSIIVYGVGTIIYAIRMTSNDNLLGTVILTIPLIIYNVVNYIKNKEDSKNLILWIINVILVSLFLFFEDIVDRDVIFLYIYLIYLVTKTMFDKNSKINKLLFGLFNFYLIVSCISPATSYLAKECEFGLDTVVITLLIVLFLKLSETYKEVKEYFILAFIVLVQFLNIDADIIFVLINLVTITYGIYSIISGNKNNSNKEIKKGISIIILVILFRFISSNLSFGEKSMMFLIAGICFLVAPKIINKKLGEKENEKSNQK